VSTYAADFGPLVIETDVDAAVVATLQRWLPTYLGRIRRERDGMARLQAPRGESYSNALEDETFPDARLPAVLVTTARTEGQPAPNGNGIYSVAWTVVVSAIIGGRTHAETRDFAAIYGGCCRRALVHHPSLDGFAGDLVWTGGSVARVALPQGDDRYLAAGISQFVVYVDEALGGEGPLEPDAPSPYDQADPASPDRPYDPLATVADITLDVQAREP
jgi:hypothetical protein